MYGAARTLTLTAALAALPMPAAAIGEIFKLETTGTEYCGNFNNAKFNAKNNVDLWVYVASDTEWDLSFSPLFVPAVSFPLIGITYFVSPKKLSFTGAQTFPSASVSMQGFLTLDKFGAVTKAQGTFIQNGIDRLGCFSSGKFTTTQRLN
ncbi:MAG: hypothetical protein ACHQ6T_15580 [Myxococcota bacterium]